jgi:hypothetical protein
MQGAPITAAELAEFRAKAHRLKEQGERLLPHLDVDPERQERTRSMLATLEEMLAEVDAELSEGESSQSGT